MLVESIRRACTQALGVTICVTLACTSAARVGNDAGPGTLTAPSGLVATPSRNSLEVELAWTAESAATGGYQVFRSAGGSPTQLATSNVNGYLDRTVTLGTTFTYTVRAIGANGVSDDSIAATALTIPGTPTGIGAAAITTTSIVIGWAAEAIGAVGGDEVSYVAGQGELAVGAATGTSFTATGLQPDTAYTFTITARNATGSGTPATAVFTTNSESGSDGGSDAGTDGGSDAGAGAFPLAAYGADSIIILNWPAQSADAYRIFRADTPTGNYAQVGTSPSNDFADLGVSAHPITTNNSYSYYVIPVAGGVADPASSIATTNAFGIAVKEQDVFVDDLDATLVSRDFSNAFTSKGLNSFRDQDYKIIPAYPDGGLDLDSNDTALALPHGSSNGYAVFPGLPHQPYILYATLPPLYSVMSANARALDLSTARVGRSNLVAAMINTRLSFNAVGIDPWDSTNDSLHAVSWGSGNSSYSVSPVDQQFATPLDPGATSVDGGTAEILSIFEYGNLLSGTHGDALYLLQQEVDQSGPVAYSAVRKGFVASSLSLVNAIINEVDVASASSSQVQMQNTIRLAADGGAGAFRAYTSAVNPTARVGGFDPQDGTAIDFGEFELVAQPEFSAYGGYGINSVDTAPVFSYGGYGGDRSFAPQLVSATFPAQDADIRLGAANTLSYVNPFPARWEVAVAAGVPFTALLPTPTAPMVQITGRIQTQGRLANYQSSNALVVSAPISPVTAPKINGASAWGVNGRPLSFDGSAPLRLDWSQPAIGSPTFYAVTIWGVLDADGLDLQDNALFTLQTEGTSAVVPANLLPASADFNPPFYYVAYITAIHTDADRLGTSGVAAPARYEGNASSADCISSVFTMTYPPAAVRGGSPGGQ